MQSTWYSEQHIEQRSVGAETEREDTCTASKLLA